MEETLVKRPAEFRPAPVTGSMRDHCTAGEWETRVELAALFRLVHMYGLDDIDNGAICARVKDDPDRWLIHPYGLFWDEAKASDFILIDEEGDLVRDDDRFVGIGVINLCQWIFGSRPEINFFIHGHVEEVQAVSAIESRLLPLSQAAIYLMHLVRYIDYDFLEDDVYGKHFVDTIADAGILIAGHHGYYNLGRTAAEALFRTYYLRQACSVQIKAMATGDRLRPIDMEELQETRREMYSSENYNYDGSTEWLGWLRRLERVNPGWDL